MTVILFILIVIGALISLFAAILALGAYLAFRRARATFQIEVTDEVERLAERTTELETNISALDARAAELPIQIAELQESLSTLRVLTGTLSASLRQVQKILSFSAIKTLSAARIGKILQSASAPRNRQHTS
ncbi:MAG TPA: hypothetical protein VJ827_12050 [Rubrobacter sp.]|nr:hypothetical protein [Rubrobacter sp.]